MKHHATRRPAAAPAAISLLALALLAACAQAPVGPPPTVAQAAAFKEAPPGWVDAAPADALERGAWWALFNDPVLDALAPRVQVSNQNVAAAAAAVAQARALVREQRAALFPTLGASVSATRSGGGGAASGGGSRTALGLQAGWEPDVWGRIAGSVTAAGARADASVADLGAVQLAAQAELASNYFGLRQAELEAALLRTTISAYERSLRITGNRYQAGIAPRSDLLQAQTQLASAQAELAGTEQQRALFEHALAVLVGEAPANFTLPAADGWAVPAVPVVGGMLPATLLQRRPDIAAAERRVAAANASIGVARAAYFPAFGFSADGAQNARSIGDLFSASAASWSLGISLVQTLFDAGARSARVDGAQAAWEQAVAQYRQTVLTAFQDVEDQLASARTLALQEQLRAQAAEAAALTEQQVQNRYDAGQIGYTEVVLAQVSSLNARRARLQVTAARLDAAVALVRALGGGWQR